MHTLRATRGIDKAVAAATSLVGLSFGVWAVSAMVSAGLLESHELLLQLLLGSLLLLWVAGPYLLVAATALFVCTSRAGRGLLLLLTLALVALGPWTLGDDGGAVRFVSAFVVPLFLFKAAGLIFILVTLTEWAVRRRATAETGDPQEKETAGVSVPSEVGNPRSA